MKKQDIRLIAMDMDGTLLNPKQVISPGNAEALRLAMQAGIKLAICSGRGAGDIAMFALENGLDKCALLGTNGTYCWLNPDGVAFANHVFTAEALEEMVRILDEEQVLTAFFAQNKVLVLNDPLHLSDKWWAAHRKGMFAPEILMGKECLSKIQSPGTNKLIVVSDEREQLFRVQQRFEKIPGIEISSSGLNNLEIMPLGCNKGAAVAELAGKLGITRDQVMTFGDYDNDLPMIEWAGMGVAMGNGCKKVKTAAKFITRTNAEDGVGWAIRKIALGLEDN